SYTRILSTELRSNCAVLSAFTQVANLDQYGLGDTPMAMKRAITQTRGKRDHWENTQENAFCMNALVDYARRWEVSKPDMRVSAALDDGTMGSGTFDDFRDRALEFSTPISSAHPGTDAQVRITREGDGRLYYAARVTYFPKPDNAERINAGMDVRREYSVFRDGQWLLLENPVVISRGELVRVDLFLDLPAARNFVVVDDHVPGGLEPVNRDLATASTVDAEQGDFDAAGGSWWFKYGDWISYGVSRWSFYHRELRHDAVRFYSEYLPPGHYHLAYTAQAIAAGSFSIRPTHAAEMYDIDVYGKTIPGTLNVQEVQ
ncbi:MAG: large extracellular alpha-helical protein, partial [Gammaproteobacteria bacterium]